MYLLQQELINLGRIVGENLAGANNSFQGSLGSSCIKVMDMEAASTGMTEKQAQKLGINYKAKFISDFEPNKLLSR